MTIPSSTVPAVRAALVAGITTQINDTSVTVSNGMPLTNPDDFVAVTSVRRDTVHNGFVGSGGAGWLQEQYRVEVVSRSYRGGDDFASADVRAWAMNDAVEAFVRGDPSLAGSVIEARPESNDAEVQFAENNEGQIIGVMVEITTQIRVIAQI